MKIASFLAISLCGMGTVAGVCIAFAPQILRHLGSSDTVKGPGHLYGEAFALLFLVGLMLLSAVLAALLAWVAARYAQWPTGMKWGCWTPVPVAGASLAWLWTRLGG